MADPEAKKPKSREQTQFEAAFLRYMTTLRKDVDLTTEFRVHGGNRVDTLMTMFRTNREETLKLLLEEFLKNHYQTPVSPNDLPTYQPYVVSEIEKYFADIEERSYAHLRTMIDSRYCDTTQGKDGPIKKLVPESATGNEIYLLRQDRVQFEKIIKATFLNRAGPMRANFYGILSSEENMPKLDEVIRAEVDKLVAIQQNKA